MIEDDDIDAYIGYMAYDLSAHENDDDDPIPGVNDNNGDWNYLSPTDLPVTISIDGIDNTLLSRARDEVPIALNRLKQKLYGRRNRSNNDIPIAHLLKVWMDTSILQCIAQEDKLIK